MLKKTFYLGLILVGLSSCQQTANNKKQNIVKPQAEVILKDYGKDPLVINIDDYTIENKTFRTTLWTGDHLQLTVMSIPVGGEVGLEIHSDIEQFLRIEEGEAEVFMGDEKDNLNYIRKASADDAIFVPTGKWHNIKNTGDKPLKLYSIYAKPEHKHGTIHQTKAESDADHHDHH